MSKYKIGDFVSRYCMVSRKHSMHLGEGRIEAVIEGNPTQYAVFDINLGLCIDYEEDLDPMTTDLTPDEWDEFKLRYKLMNGGPRFLVRCTKCDAEEHEFEVRPPDARMWCVLCGEEAKKVEEKS